MDNDSNERPHKRPPTLISGHWQHDAEEQLRARIQTDQSHNDELEALASMARSTIADLENLDAAHAPDRLREAARQLTALRDALNNVRSDAVDSVDRFARAHPFWLAAGGLAFGLALSLVLRKPERFPGRYVRKGAL